MAYMIVEALCTACGACETECPNEAISPKDFVFVIDAEKCKECKGFFDSPKCAEVCPRPETCIPAE
jgi:ferredoxin